MDCRRPTSDIERGQRTGGGLVSVVVWLEGSFARDAEVGGLVLGEGRQLNPQVLQVSGGHFLVQLQRAAVVNTGTGTTAQVQVR